MLVKTVPSKWAAPTAFIKIPARLVAGKENIATLIHGGFQVCIRLPARVSLKWEGNRTSTSVNSPPQGVFLSMCVLPHENTD